ncbi:hypothetical protein N7462_004951 [Penicillium macrosclerotiorum]|uniref:uncharacterized protein n=1 Tax=Penicillium macrosclerotiorum TaxID=303699 RepID=UPI002547ED05|nr:uncharacterized protein N7462_004951 [Penicillium macrosclerotiorum]KAJ5690559.1 hypothetical protein N7462_004951 [Penicillium macrosclerotiorum]
MVVHQVIDQKQEVHSILKSRLQIRHMMADKLFQISQKGDMTTSMDMYMPVMDGFQETRAICVIGQT